MTMSIPVEIAFAHDLERREPLAVAARAGVAAFDPFAEWIEVVRVVLAPSERTEGLLRVFVTLILPSGRLTAVRHEVPPSPSGVALAVTRAIASLAPAVVERATRLRAVEMPA